MHTCAQNLDTYDELPLLKWIGEYMIDMSISESSILKHYFCLPHFAAMCIINHRNFRSRFSLVFSSLTCVYCLGPLQSTWKLLLYLRKQNSQRSSLGLSWIYTFTREVGGITVSMHLSLNTLVSLEEASGSIKLCEFYSPLPRCPFPRFCSFPQKVSSLFIRV